MNICQSWAAASTLCTPGYRAVCRGPVATSAWNVGPEPWRTTQEALIVSAVCSLFSSGTCSEQHLHTVKLQSTYCRHVHMCSSSYEPVLCAEICWLQAGAYRVILTHFSQRYPKIPVLGDSRSETTCIAFDLMTVNLAGQSPSRSADLLEGSSCSVPQCIPFQLVALFSHMLLVADSH